MTKENQQFDSFIEWNEKARFWTHGVDTVCFDTRGRRCKSALDFKRAHEENSFPVRWLLLDQVGSVALFSIGCRALKYNAEILLIEVEAMIAHGGAISNDVVTGLRAVLTIMDRVGTPAGANALHEMMLKACLVDQCGVVIGVLKDVLEDVDTWKNSSSRDWASALNSKLLLLEAQMATFK